MPCSRQHTDVMHQRQSVTERTGLSLLYFFGPCPRFFPVKVFNHVVYLCVRFTSPAYIVMYIVCLPLVSWLWRIGPPDVFGLCGQCH